MTLSERTAYLKGLMEGMKIDTETNEGKLFKAIIETLDDMALTVSDVEDVVDAVCDELDSIEEDLDAIEDYLLDEEDDDEYEDDEEDEDDFDFGDDFYAIGCRKGDVELAAKITDAIKTLIDNGKAAEISQKWFGQNVVILEGYGK